ncbi:MAG: S41 family peptidase [Atopobiaceae bacterium]|nr:S41 family peptidase [Atopobiaceae bacterium]
MVLTRPSQVTGHGQGGAKYYPDGIPGYEEIGNTAYITFDIFSMSTTDLDDYYQAEDLASFGDDDTFALLMKAHKQIHRENSPIENVVVDLSCNAGGDADCAIFLIAWFLGEAAIGTKDCMTGAMCTSTYRCDASRDRKFDEGDTVTDKNLFSLISPFSFSCANLVPCMFKESGRVTLLGRTSGGGACNVQPISSAWGTSFQISAPRRLSFLKNGSFYDIDRGADPDFVLTKPDQFYDRPALTDYINSLCWGGK